MSSNERPDGCAQNQTATDGVFRDLAQTNRQHVIWADCTALRRQRPGRPQLFVIDRLLLALPIMRAVARCLESMVRPVTVVQWHRQGRLFSDGVLNPDGRHSVARI
jgi:hypothetical protein